MNHPHSNSHRRRTAAVAFAAVLTIASSTPAAASDPVPYDDHDSNYLKVLYHFTYPVGKVAELVFFRPLHVIASFSQPDPRRDKTAEDSIGECIGFRPSRKCSRHD